MHENNIYLSRLEARVLLDSLSLYLMKHNAHMLKNSQAVNMLGVLSQISDKLISIAEHKSAASQSAIGRRKNKQGVSKCVKN